MTAAKKKVYPDPNQKTKQELRMRCVEAATLLGAPGASQVNGSSGSTVLFNARDFYKFVTGDL